MITSVWHASNKGSLALRLTLMLAIIITPRVVDAHMSIFDPSMYESMSQSSDWLSTGNPANPIGPNLGTIDEWWFRGPEQRAVEPASTKDLPAGGQVKFEISCNVAFTSFGDATSENDVACPEGWGPYHADPSALVVKPSLISGCALGIADVEHPDDVTMDNMYIISVNQSCVHYREQYFDIPASLPACTGANCIGAWFWLANTGTGNFYMTGFKASITNATSTTTHPTNLSDTFYCDSGDSSCSQPTGAVRPLYAYNTPTNVYNFTNANRPGYHDLWGFVDGAQEHIFGGSSASAGNGTAASSGTTVNSRNKSKRQHPNRVKRWH